MSLKKSDNVVVLRSHMNTLDYTHPHSLLESTEVAWRTKWWNDSIIRTRRGILALEKCFVFFTPKHMSQGDTHSQKCILWNDIIFCQHIFIAKRSIVITNELNTLNTRYPGNMNTTGIFTQRIEDIRNISHLIMTRIFLDPIIISLSLL